MKIIDIGIEWMDKEPDGAQMIANVARMGRICYQSEGKTSDEDFVRRLIERGHTSVLEHEKVSVIVLCDRGVTHELVRHRIASYSQESTRYCNYSREKFGSGVTYINLNPGLELDPAKLNELQRDLILTEWLVACEDAEKHYLRMLELGASPQIARSVLNNSTKTQIAITMNLREWRHFFALRCAPAAHPQMRELALKLLEKLHDAIPVLFDDLMEVYSGC
jgi:thymidylate synthase (FAD)